MTKKEMLFMIKEGIVFAICFYGLIYFLMVL